MLNGISPTITSISNTTRKGLGHKGVILDHLNRGDKITFQGRYLDKWQLTVSDIDNGSATLQLGRFSYGKVTVFDTTNKAVLEGNTVVDKSPDFIRGKTLKLNELPLQFQSSPDSLRGKSVGIVFGDGTGGELKLFVDHACPSSLNNGDECSIGFISNNCDFDLDRAKIIEAKNELIIPLI